MRILKDTDGELDSQPTLENIVRGCGILCPCYDAGTDSFSKKKELRQLVSEVETGDHLFFYCKLRSLPPVSKLKSTPNSCWAWKASQRHRRG